MFEWGKLYVCMCHTVMCRLEAVGSSFIEEKAGVGGQQIPSTTEIDHLD